MEEITLVTGNLGKWKIASNIFKKYNIKLLQEKMKTPEMQSYDVEEVSKHSAIYAAKKLNKPVIKSDVGYYIEDLNGFPGPFLKYINGMLTSEDILKLLENKQNRKIKLKECLTYADENGKVKQFISIEEATISTTSMGEGSTFDKIVILQGDKLPKAMNTEEENLKHFEKQLVIYDAMAKFLTEED